MKPLVLVSLEDPSGCVCIDILDLRDGTFGYVPCRRDPEDGHGWRHTSSIVDGFDSRDAAQAAAQAAGILAR